MYGVVLMAALAAGGEVPGSHGWNGNGCGCWAGRCLGPCLPTGPYSGGRFWLGLFEGWQVGPALTMEEEKRWADYVARLEGAERQNMDRLWSSVDAEGKRKLLDLLETMEKKWAGKGAEKPVPEEKPLSAEEQKRWDDHVKKLPADKRKDAEEQWKKADLKGKREILKNLPKGDEES